MKTRCAAYMFGPGGLLDSLTVQGENILAAPMRLEATVGGKTEAWTGAAHEHGVVNALLPDGLAVERRRRGAEPCGAGPTHGQLGEPFPNGVTDRQPEDEDLRGVARHGREIVRRIASARSVDARPSPVHDSR